MESNERPGLRFTPSGLLMDRTVRKRYRDLTGNSGVRWYALGLSFIDIWFKDGAGYRYDEYRPGMLDVEAMKRLAEEGHGLATYINQHVGSNFARKL